MALVLKFPSRLFTLVRQVLRRASQERCEKDTLIVAWEYGLRSSVEVELGFGVDVAVALGKS